MSVLIATLFKLLLSSGVASLLLKKLFSFILADKIHTSKEKAEEKLNAALKEAFVDLLSDLQSDEDWLASAEGPKGFIDKKEKGVKDLVKKLTSKEKADIEMSEEDLKEYSRKKLSTAYFYNKKRTLNSLSLDPSLEKADSELAKKLFQ